MFCRPNLIMQMSRGEMEEKVVAEEKYKVFFILMLLI
jgi:hypothetical protein